MIDSEVLQVTLLVTNLLDELGIPYVIGGSMASIIHGMLRTTRVILPIAPCIIRGLEPLPHHFHQVFCLALTRIESS